MKNISEATLGNVLIEITAHRFYTSLITAVALTLGLSFNLAVAADSDLSLPDTPLPYLGDGDLPERTPPIIELGPHFLGRGPIDEGFELPTGAVWQPALWVFGDFRTGINVIKDKDSGDLTEWANSLDLFANLQLSGTERVLLGVNALSDHGGDTGYVWKPNGNTDGAQNFFNADISTLFFEGELGEIFPRLDPTDSGAYDLGFAIGRQPLFFQEGIMLNDTVDAIAVNRDTIQFPGVVDMRMTYLFGWDQVGRDDNEEDKKAYLFGLFTEADLRNSTVNVDVAYVKSKDETAKRGLGRGKGDGLYAGFGSTQRFGHINTSLHADGSWALDTPNDAIGNGYVFMAETSLTPFGTHNVAYLNGFAGIDHYSSASRGPSTGGPLGRVGILFASPGLGRGGSPLSNRADEVYGGALGYQMFFNGDRTQLIVEAGGRKAIQTTGSNQSGVGMRFQQALGRRHVVQLDAFATALKKKSNTVGARGEWLVRF